MKPIKADMDFYDGTIVVKNVDAYYCEKCKEELFTSEQAATAQQKLKEIYPGFEPYAINKKIAKIGNSLAIPLPKEVADFMHLHKGEKVKIVVKNRKRIIIDA